MNAVPFSKYRKRRQDKYQRLCAQLAQMRAAKELKRLANPVEREPQFERFYRFEFGVRDKTGREAEAWHDLVSVRHAATALGLVLKFV